MTGTGKTERTYYAIFGLFNLSWSFVGAIYAVFLLSRGLDLFEINLVLATYLVTAFAFEVPTGAVADVFGRKVSFLLGCVVRAAGFALYFVSDSLPEFMFAEFVDAIGTTLATGSLDAWAVDGMKAEGSKRSTSSLFSRAHVLARVAMIASGLGGAYIADVDLAIPWILGAATFTATAVLGALWMDEPPRSEHGPRESVVRAIGEGLEIVRRSPTLLGLCLLIAVTAFATMPAHLLWQPRIEALVDDGVRSLGWVWAVLNVAALGGSAIAPRLVARWSPGIVLAVTSIGRSVGLGLAAVATGFPLVAFGIVLQDLGFGVSEPVHLSWTSEETSSARRATVLSVRSMSFTLGGGIGLVVVGLVAREHGIPAAWLVSTAVLMLCAVGFIRLSRASRAVEPEASDPTVVAKTG